MKATTTFVVVLVSLFTIRSVSAYTLSVSSAFVTGFPTSGGSATLTVSLQGAAGESILSASVLLQVQVPVGGPALTMTGGNGLAPGMIFAGFPVPPDGGFSAQSANSPVPSA